MVQVDPAVADADRRASEEMERFSRALPELLQDSNLRGRWVVFLDGEVVQSFDDRKTGYHWAVDNLGYLSGFVLAPVEPDRVYHLSGFSRLGFQLEDDET